MRLYHSGRTLVGNLSRQLLAVSLLGLFVAFAESENARSYVETWNARIITLKPR